VSSLALAFALGAAVCHATWNVLLAKAKDAHAATALMLVLSIVFAAPLALAAGWRLEARAWPFLLASAAIQVVYVGLLNVAYARYELAVVYPLARGLGPVFMLVGSRLGVTALPTAPQIRAIFVVCAGVLLVRGFKRTGHVRDIGVALLIACCIANYTLLDKLALQFAHPLTYLTLVLVVPALTHTAHIVRMRGSAALGAALGWRTLAAAGATVGSYSMGLIALQLAPAAAIAAVRETSVVIVTILAAVVLHERVTRIQLLGAGCVALGVALLART
jgi:drug/metabolite transporter (DMT)-like permease